jgi:methionyl-tRNA formyltransferase
MRIILIGQAAFGVKVLETLMKKGENVVSVYAPPDGTDGRSDSLKDLARTGGIQTFQPKTYKDDQTFLKYKALEPDLTVMAFVSAIIPERFFHVPVHGAINYHPSLLPRHRGASAINWAVIMGDTLTGLTIFRPDAGIDAGPILLQKEIDIGPEDTVGSLYFDRLFPMGVEALMEAIELIKAGTAPTIPQNEAEATYEPICDDSVAAIDWNKPAQELHDLIRGCDPQPGAFVFFKGDKARVYGSKLAVGTTDKIPGTVLRIDEQGIELSVSGGKMVISKIKPSTGKKMSATNFSDEYDLKVGDKFTDQLELTST